MVRLSTKKTTENQKSIKGESFIDTPFSSDCFVQSFPLDLEEDDIPMWWKVVREPGITFKQYKKEKKRAEKEIASLEEYLKKLTEENKKYSEKLKQESEKYKLECDMRDHAFIERRKKEELYLSTEREQARKRVLEEKLLAQARSLEELRAKDEEIDSQRELEAIQKFEQEKAELEKIQKAEKLRQLDAEKEKLGRAQKERLTQKEIDDKKRTDIANSVERETIKKLRRAHKIKDYEFTYPLPSFGNKNNDNVIEFSALCLKSKKDKKYLSNPLHAVITTGVTVTRELSSKEMRAVCSALTRQVQSGALLSGGARYKSIINLHEIDRKKQKALLSDEVFILSQDLPSDKGLLKVENYLKKHISSDKIDLAIDYLQRLNVKKARALTKKILFSCSVGEMARINLVCALLSNKKLTVLCEPQQWLDMPTRESLVQIVGEWQGKQEGRALWIITSDEEFCK